MGLITTRVGSRLSESENQSYNQLTPLVPAKLLRMPKASGRSTYNKQLGWLGRGWNFSWTVSISRSDWGSGERVILGQFRNLIKFWS